MNPKANWFFDKDAKWQREYGKLRMIVLDCGLIEELKWGVPCYTFQKSNIVLIHGFKEYCALLFNIGSLLNDTNGILIQQTENVQSARQIRFTNNKEIEGLEAIIKAYIFEAMEIEKLGLKVGFKKTTEFNIPEELQIRLKENTELNAAFENLTPGRQKRYLLYFSQAKQSSTRKSRIERCIPKILEGKGLNDR
ncbi:YdeI/OmpD-associated family protein [Pontibacter harenae]|uniref:YdeI/OmpD-associated family protein n=1 Tax=Pontibacter harenae TaxID=2894083 RepID=UPI001E5A49B3|nr:YdeI/OmpD-associated family protein [Pontibacter harenae]MCC9169209.1 YdeI/OmpD-associated family protein [Pontibacter harenae]